MEHRIISLILIIIGVGLSSGVVSAEISQNYLAGFFTQGAGLQSFPMGSFLPTSTLFSGSNTINWFTPAAQAINSYGSISVQSDPPGASVYLGDSFKGITPLTIGSVSPGYYGIQVVKGGYLSYTSNVNVLPGLEIPIRATLVKIPTQYIIPTPTSSDNSGSEFGTLIIKSTHDGDPISLKSHFGDPTQPLLDGRWHDNVGVTPAFWLDVVPPGTYSIALNRLSPNGCYCTVVTVRAGETNTIYGDSFCPLCGAGC